MDKVVQVIKDLFGWFFGTCFVLLALGLFFGGTVFGGVASLLFGLGITPLRRKLMWSAKVSFIVLSCLFLISCGSLAFIGSTEQAEEKTQQGIQEQSQQQTIIMEDSIGAEEVEAEEPETVFAALKSMSQREPSGSSITLEGLMSRWMIFCSRQSSSALHRSFASFTTCASLLT